MPTCAVSTFSSTDSMNAFVNLRVSYVVAVLRPLMRGDRKFSSHHWVNELDTIRDHIANNAEIESHAPSSEALRSLWVTLRTASTLSCQGSSRTRILAMATSILKTTTTRLSLNSRNTRGWKRFCASGTTTQILLCRRAGGWKHQL